MCYGCPTNCFLHNNNKKKTCYQIRFEDGGWGQSNNWFSYITLYLKMLPTHTIIIKRKPIYKIKFIDGGGSEVTTGFRISHHLKMHVPTVVQAQKVGFAKDLYYVSHDILWYLL